MKLENRVAIVTGAARGIGRACAQRLLHDGARVVIADIDEERLNATAEELGEGGYLLALPVDVTSQNQVNDLVAAAVKRFGRLLYHRPDDLSRRRPADSELRRSGG